jgi:hypothetical protein
MNWFFTIFILPLLPCLTSAYIDTKLTDKPEGTSTRWIRVMLYMLWDWNSGYANETSETFKTGAENVTKIVKDVTEYNKNNWKFTTYTVRTNYFYSGSVHADFSMEVNEDQYKEAGMNDVKIKEGFSNWIWGGTSGTSDVASVEDVKSKGFLARVPIVIVIWPLITEFFLRL